MELLIPVMGLMFVLIYFTMKKREDKVWKGFRQRHRERLRRPVSDEPLDPNFQFNQPPSEPDEENPFRND
ncbi:MAG: hypothetical protein K2R98_19730 [Gemmataceae bacterium]|nr:hypothetical protein [Gemmataceae bacterium]